jgi:DNA-binding NarL/FixJ family response regulator
VILAADETREQVVELMNLGAMTYIRKGVDPHILARKLRASIVNHSRVEARLAAERALAG